MGRIDRLRRDQGEDVVDVILAHGLRCSMLGELRVTEQLDPGFAQRAPHWYTVSLLAFLLVSCG